MESRKMVTNGRQLPGAAAAAAKVMSVVSDSM